MPDVVAPRSRRQRPQAQSAQLDYALHTLGWASFQDLCTSIFEIVFDRPVNFFSKTHDSGRDGTFKGFVNAPLALGEERDSTLQTKHVSRESTSLTLANFSGERAKVRDLVQRGRAHSYVIMTNAVVAGTEAEKIEAALRDDGVIEPVILGRAWINKKIHENSKIRATVPRLYGLGDLSWILDERAIAQATEVLGSLGNDMRCYVRTKAHLKAVDALLKHGFVLLIGEPAVGKSTIAANLAMAAIDIDSCDVIRVTGPQDIVTYWNPQEKNRFFWVDDAFGTTQYLQHNSDLWNKVLPTMSAALRCGNRFVLTSRDYIWRQAVKDLKSETFKPLQDGRVVIYAEDLSKEEKERILYNHVKFGDQPQTIRRWMKPYLDHLAANRHFTPEIARRLGNSFFTRELSWSPESLQRFVDRPRHFLSDVIKQLEPGAQAAVALIFLNGGRVASPLTEDESTRIIQKTLGVSCPSIRPAMEHLNNTLFLHVTESGQTYWTYKHPTVADAYAALITERPELLEIYLRGAKISSLLNEVVYGTRSFAGAALRVPRTLYDILSKRAQEAPPRAVRMFLLIRADAEFRKRFLEQNRRVISEEIFFGNPVLEDAHARFFLLVNREELMNSSEHCRVVDQLCTEITGYGDVTFLLDDEFISFLGPENHSKLLEVARRKLAPSLTQVIEQHASECDADDPEGYFADNFRALEALTVLFPNDNDVKSRVDAAFEIIEDKITEIKAGLDDPADEDRDNYAGGAYGTTSFGLTQLSESVKSVFDDIDS
jgi:energy-coupling factor transporter ATP-binding protein EcfA2